MSKSEQFWTIGELTKEFDVTARALRFYEDKGLLSPLRDGTMRKYSARDRVRLILLLQGKRFGLSLDEIRDLLNLYHSEGGRRVQLVQTAQKLRHQIKVLEDKKNDLEEVLKTLREYTDDLENTLASTQNNIDA